LGHTTFSEQQECGTLDDTKCMIFTQQEISKKIGKKIENFIIIHFKMSSFRDFHFFNSNSKIERELVISKNTFFFCEFFILRIVCGSLYFAFSSDKNCTIFTFTKPFSKMEGLTKNLKTSRNVYFQNWERTRCLKKKNFFFSAVFLHLTAYIMW
jgi:hypothetical protein